MPRKRMKLGESPKTKKEILSTKMEREKFLHVLELLMPGLERTGMVEQTAHFVFLGDKICTYNDRVCVLIPYETGLECSVEADSFFKLVTKLEGEEIALRRKGNQVVVKSGKVQFGVSCSDDDQVPKLVDDLRLDKIKWTELSKDFVEGLSLCVFSVSRDMTRLDLTGVYVSGEDLLSSDRYRISWYRSDDKMAATFLLPGTGAVALLEYSPTHYSVKEGEEAWAHFKNDAGVIFSARLLIEKFREKEVKEFFPKAKKGKKKVVLPVKELMGIIDRAKVLLSDVYLLDRKIFLEFTGDKIICKSEKQGRGWFVEKIAFKGKEKFEFVINPDFLEQALKYVVELSFVGEDKILLTAGNLRHLIALK